MSYLIINIQFYICILSNAFFTKKYLFYEEHISIKI